jgi:DNA polymerase I-like protein with 3'-5' exonuclease and polymerase domains
MTQWNIEAPTTEYYDHNSPGLDAVIREVIATPEVAIDTETTGLVVWKDVPLYWSLAWGTRRMTLNVSVLHHFAEAFADPSKRWLFANAKYDKHILANVNSQIAGKLVDTQVQHALLYEEQSHRLKDMNQHLFGWKWQDFQDTFGKITKAFSPTDLIRTAEANNFPLLCEYAANDAWGTLQIYQELRTQLQRAPTHSLFRDHPLNIQTLWDLFDRVEVPYTSALWATERRGVRVDLGYLESIAPTAIAEIEELERAICKEAGKVINPKSTKQLREYFFDKLQVTPRKMSKGGATGVRNPSVDESFLQHYSDQIPMAKMLLRHRGLSKLHGTYIVGLRDRVDPYGRIHTRFNQDVARCLPAGELVLTSRGYLPVEEVRVNDLVITHTGRKRRVVETSKHKPTPILKITLENGLQLRTNGHHPYLTRFLHSQGWVPANELKIGNVLFTHSSPETWREVPKHANYEVSSWGRVRKKATGALLALQKKDKWGHLKVTLTGPSRKSYGVHALVARAFLPDPEAGKEVRHKNGIAWDNTVDNLVYGSSKDNTADSRAHGTLNGAPKLTKEQVQEILAVERRGQPPSSTSKLTYDVAQIIREKYALGSTGRAELARTYQVSFQAIDNIVKDLTWTKPVSGVSASELSEKYGVSEAAIRDIWAKRRWDRDLSREPTAIFGTSFITEIQYEYDRVTYGLTIDEDESHVTGGIVTHNTGRLSSSDPNCQNIPKPENDKWGLRGAFIADEGNRLSVIDYEQLEMRLLAAASGEPGMIEVINKGWDIHMGNASMIFGMPYEEIKAAKKTPEDQHTARQRECLAARAASKDIGFGIIYGMGPDKLASRLGITRAEAEAKIKQFKKAYPAVDAFTREAVAETEQTGYAFTILGRRRNVPEIASYRRDERMKGERIATNCVDMETEALTTRGWLHGDTVTRKDKLLAFDMVKGTLQWEYPTDIKLFPEYAGPIVSIESKTFSALTTPDHRWAVYNRTTCKAEEKRTNTISTNGDHRIFRTGTYQGGRKQDLDFLELVGWFLTDGFICKKQKPTHSQRVGLCQSKRANPANVKRIDNLLARLGIRTSRSVNCAKCVYWYFIGRYADKLVRLFPKRELTPAFMTSLNRGGAKAVLESMLLGDGSLYMQQNLQTFCCKSETTAGMFQILAALAGHATTSKYRDMRKYKPKSKKMKNVPKSSGCYYATLLRRDKVQVQKKHITKMNTACAVWCPVLPSTFFVARRQGKVYITGNTQIQGSAADVVKMAQVLLHKSGIDRRFGAYACLQVHDELMHEIPAECAKAADAEIREWMEHPFPFDLAVPLAVSGSIGRSWAEAK